MAEPLSATISVVRSEPRSRTALWLEAIALRHQVAVLERSRTRRPCFRHIDRLFWILLVARLARKPGDRSARYGVALAP
jgi:hypothetical protein